MADYSVPKQILALKPKGTMVKKIKGSYYVYNYKNIKTNGKWKIKMGECIGSIREDTGFIPNASYVFEDRISVYEYGQYYLVHEAAASVLESLKLFFNNEDAIRIYLISIIFYINGMDGISSLEDYYDQSYFCLKYPSVSLSYYKAKQLLDALGRREDKKKGFLEYLIDLSDEMAIDGHDFVSYSKLDDLSQYGNKYHKTGNRQYNMISAYDINTHTPVFAKMFSGSLLDKTSIKDVLKAFNIKGKLLIMDAGFYSADNIKLFEEGNSYIIPLSENLNDYKKYVDTIDYSSSFIYKAYRKSDPVFYREYDLESKRIIVYKNMSINALEADDYQGKIGIDDNYTNEEYERLKDRFGIIILQTNTSLSPEEVYYKYKSRWSIETFYDTLKNKIDFDALNQQSYYILEGLCFISVIIGLIHHEFKKALQGSKINYRDAFMIGRSVKIHNNGKDYEIANIAKKSRQLFEALGHTVISIADI